MSDKKAYSLKTTSPRTKYVCHAPYQHSSKSVDTAIIKPNDMDF